MAGREPTKHLIATTERALANQARRLFMISAQCSYLLCSVSSGVSHRIAAMVNRRMCAKPHGLHIPATRCGDGIKDRPDRYRRVCQTPHCFSHLKAHSAHLRL